MSIKTIAWTTGGRDNIYIDMGDGTGDETLSITSDPNTGAARSKTINVVTGNLVRNIIVNQEAANSPILIYELENATTTKNYDTGVKLFDTPKSFTILCDATYNNYYWTSQQCVFSSAYRTSGSDYAFAFGRIASLKDMHENEVYATANRYSAILMCNPASKKTGCSVFARSNGSARRKFAIRYDHTTRMVKANNSSTLWYYIDNEITGKTDTIKFFTNNGSGTMHRFLVYQGLLTDQQVTDFINS